MNLARISRLISVLILGFSSGLPLALTSSTLQAWFTVAGLPIVTIGLLGLVGQPYVYKFIWAPLFDRYRPPFLDFRRGWIFLIQIILVISISAMGFLDPKSHPILLVGLALWVAFLSASQDIVIDAYRTDILEVKERGLGAAFFTGGYRIAMLVSGGIALIFADHFGWALTYYLMAACMGVSMIATWFAPSITPVFDRPHSLKTAILEPLREFFTRDKAWLILLFIITFKLGDQVIQLMSNPFLLRGLEFSLTEVGIANKTVGFSATIFGSFIGGILLMRISLYRALFGFGVLQAFSNLAYMLLALIGKNYVAMLGIVSLENLASGMSGVALIAFFMNLCDHRYTATQFALFTALYAVERVYIAPAISVLTGYLSWPAFFFITVILAIIGLLILTILNRVDNKAFTFD